MSKHNTESSVYKRGTKRKKLSNDVSSSTQDKSKQIYDPEKEFASVAGQVTRTGVGSPNNENQSDDVLEDIASRERGSLSSQKKPKHKRFADGENDMTQEANIVASVDQHEERTQAVGGEPVMADTEEDDDEAPETVTTAAGLETARSTSSKFNKAILR